METLPLDVPPAYRRQLTTLLAQIPLTTVVSDLVTTHHDPQGNLVRGAPVVNKPWEWIENIGEPPMEEERENDEKRRLRVKHLVKNSGSLSLEYFDAKLTDEGLIDIATAQEQKGGFMGSFEDGLTENIFIRDWRETRLEMEQSSDSLARLRSDFFPEGLTTTDHSNHGQGSKASPTSSVISRTSTQATSSSLRQHQSPQNNRSTSTIHDIIDVDSLPSTTNSSSMKGKGAMKRKAMASTSDDDIEIVEGPVLNTSGMGSKKPKASKAPVSNKPKVKKR